MTMASLQQETAGVKLDFALMPDYVKQDLAEAAWNAFQRFMRRPDARAILDAEKERLMQEGSTLLDPKPKKRGANK